MDFRRTIGNDGKRTFPGQVTAGFFSAIDEVPQADYVGFASTAHSLEIQLFTSEQPSNALPIDVAALDQSLTDFAPDLCGDGMILCEIADGIPGKSKVGSKSPQRFRDRPFVVLAPAAESVVTGRQVAEMMKRLETATPVEVIELYYEALGRQAWNVALAARSEWRIDSIGTGP